MLVLETVTKEIKAPTIGELLSKVERHVLVGVLRAHKMHKTNTAKSLGISRQGLYAMMHRHGVSVNHGQRKAHKSD
jgi:DNA-binding NtrC family response regulator